MSLEVIILGSAGSIPTKTRSLPAIMVRRKGELILFDCGEGVQRQMMRTAIGFDKRMKVLITHMHGDHVLGLPGILQTMSLLGRKKTLEIYGPEGLGDFVEAIDKTVQFALSFPLEVSEIKNEGVVCEEREYKICCAEASHSTIAFAYSLEEKPRPGKFHPERAKSLGIPKGELWSKLQNGSAITLGDNQLIRPDQVMDHPRAGRKIVYTGDSISSQPLIELARYADLLIHDCTFDDKLTERALEDGHSTPSQAARTAMEAKAKRLILTHISARYKTPSLLLKQATKLFPNTIVAKDLTKINLPLPK
ncbi:MAG: ribonuclease Z [Candidatus Bathyarchaeota archaeon]|nr:MAG: ribonuclease Z [Candidatus Bathyarchaeota archaeon]